MSNGLIFYRALKMLYKSRSWTTLFFRNNAINKLTVKTFIHTNDIYEGNYKLTRSKIFNYGLKPTEIATHISVSPKLKKNFIKWKWF